MNKNTILGFICIGAILLGFSWYNTKIFKEQKRAEFVADSIANAEYIKEKKYQDSLAASDTTYAKMLADSVSAAALAGVTDSLGNAPVYIDSLLESASNAEAGKYVLENKKIRVEFTSKGAQPCAVLVKDYVTFDSLPLNLIQEDYSKFSLDFFSGQQLSSADFNFNATQTSDSSIVFTLPFSNGGHLDFAYTLPEDGYVMGLDVRMSGLTEARQSYVNFNWDLLMPRFEKGYDNEKNYSTVVYKYPGEEGVESLGLRKASSEEDISTKVQWVAFQQQFFSAILMNSDSFDGGGKLAMKFYSEDEYMASRKLMYCHAELSVSAEKNSQEQIIPLKFYFGPNLYKELKSYNAGFEKIVPLGGWLIGWINRVVIINCFDFLSRFISNYGIIILVLTILIKLVISPLTFKSYMSSAKMKVLKPEVEKINAKYPKKEDAMKKQQETMALYQSCGVNMLGGCLPMLLQFPVLFAMFRFFPASFELRGHRFLWAADLSGYDSILDLPFRIPLYGDHISLFALLMAISLYFYSRMNMDQMPSSGQMAGMKTMQLYFMPLFMLVLCNNFSSGLSYYYMLSNFITIFQTWLIRKYFVDEKKIYAQLKSRAASSKSKPKSKWQLRLEEMQKRQAQMQKENEERRRNLRK